MSWEVDFVREAVLALGAAHRASSLCLSAENKQEGRKSKILGMQAYGKAMRLISSQIKIGDPGKSLPAIVTLLLFTYFEVSLNCIHSG
jgi:hypothetical protein